MIFIEAEGTKLGLSFAHPTINPGTKKQHRLTTCEVYDLCGETARLLGYNESVCSKNDNFKRATGRKIALARAICQHDYGVGTPKAQSTCLKCGSYRTASLPLSKDLRTKIWLTYFDAIVSKYPEPKAEDVAKTEE